MKRIFLILTMILSVGMLRANHWNPNAGQFADYMTVTAVLQINGTEQQSTQLELGAFCGTEVRGSKYAQLAPNGRYIFRLPCWGNAGDTFSFRLYDAVMDEELDYLVCETVLTYNANGYGGLVNPFVLNFTGSNTQAYNLSITGYGESAGGYYLIAPPFDNIDPATIEGMTEGAFDLYYFDQSESGEEWRNYEAEPFNLESGKGYLYAHKTDVTLSFTGTPYNGNGQVTLSKTEGVPFAGWNLVGNPFAQTANIGNRPFYVMREDGAEIIVAKTAAIAPMQGIFVIAAENGETLTFSTSNSASHSSRIVLSLLHGRSTPIDRAIIRFNEDGSLPKMMLHPNSTKLYIPDGGKDYAMVSAGRDGVHTVSTEVGFKAAENGTYTLSIDIDNLDLDYLHLLDNKTGADVDLLLTPNYTFEGSTTDNTNRFSLVYASTMGIEEGNAPIAYYADGQIHLTVETCQSASLQIVDMTGRVILCRDASNASAIATTGMTPGVYVLRLINGDSVKTQKIVVR